MNKETIKEAREALDNMDDYARMNTGVNAIGPRGVLERFISEVERTASPVSQMTDATIREIFMAHGFTIKEGQTDLKPYVYAAARALLSSAPAAPVAEPAPAVGSSMWSLIDEYARAKAVYEYSTDRDEADRQRKERDAAKEALQAALAAQPQPVCRHYECRRYCKGDGEWTDWTVCSDEYFRLNKDDRSFEFRIAASQQAAEPVACGVVEHRAVPGGGWYAHANWQGEVPAHGAKLYAAPAGRAEFEKSICMGMDAMRILRGLEPKNYTAPEISAALTPAIQQPQDERVAEQRRRMQERFANRPKTPATADFDLPAPNDAIEPQPQADESGLPG